MSDPQVSALLRPWLELVAERFAVPGVSVRMTGSSLHALLPMRLLLTLAHDADGWVVSVQSVETLAHLGSAGRPFSRVGVVRLPIEPGCADPAVAAAELKSLCDVRSLLARVEGVSEPELLSFWRARAELN